MTRKTLRDRMTQGAAWLGIVANLFLAAIKAVAGLLGHSSALVADAAHSFTDSLSSIAVLVGLKLSAKPPDANHPYGHGKAETIAAKSVAVALIVFALLMLAETGKGLLRPEEVRVPSALALWVAMLSILVKEMLYQYKSRLGHKYSSEAILADAWHHRSDAMSSVVALVGIGGAILGGGKWKLLDPLAGAIIAAVLLGVGVKIFRRTALELMETMVPDKQIAEIRRAAEATPGVLGTNVVRGRRAGDRVIVEIHIEVDRAITVHAGHEIARDVRQRLRDGLTYIGDTLVHVEPWERETESAPGSMANETPDAAADRESGAASGAETGASARQES